MVKAGDDCAGAADRVSTKHNGLVCVNIGDAMMVDNTEQFGLIDTVHGL